MKYFILGATGMAGHMIALYLMEQGHDVTTFSSSKLDFSNKHIIGDAKNFELISKIILDEEFDFVINCVGILNTNCDKNITDCILLNSVLPHYIATVISSLKTKMIHLSTDCVFSGIKGNYFEQSPYDGQSLYDRTKALGEVIDSKNLTFRNSIIGPDMKESGIGLFNWFMKQENTIKGYSKVLWNGVTTLVLAKAIEKVASLDISGVYHLVSSNNISKFNLLKIFNTNFKHSKVNIQSDESIVADKSLLNTRTDYIFDVPTYENMVNELKEWVLKHSHLYKHYRLT